MGVITTGSNPKLLWPGINSVFGNNYDEFMNGAEWRQIFEVQKSEKNYEEDVGVSTFGLAKVKPEGQGIEYDTSNQTYVVKYVNRTVALGFIVSQEEIEDNQYKTVALRRAKALAFSMNQTREFFAANVLNNATNPAYPGGDGVSLLNDNHPIIGGTVSNKLSADLSENALEQMTIGTAGFVDDRNNRINIKPVQLIVPRQLIYTATRILKNIQWRPDTANRDINAMAMLNVFPKGIVVNHYLTDPDQFFIQTNCMDGFKCMERIRREFKEDNDFDTTNKKYRARERYRFGYTDFRCCFGSPGV